ncbi:MAG TPA: polysaccharide biosynthesis/export family protein [Cyclobacteriaceae bacterium]|jgi:polysaccharide export outer membrane protein|nr:polysaccharide biosynthesis/export family protein [Cyclobacteriaceae bacterium]
MRSALLLFFAGAVVLSSCVPNRKFVYLQKNDLGKRDLAKDTTTRKYDVEAFDYKIQTNDILSIRYNSLTTKEFDVLGQNQQVTGNLVGGALLLGDLVDEQGQIPMPVVGKVTVAGLSVFQIQDTLQKLANVYLESPVVKVRLLNYRATFLGEVFKEGSVTFNNNRVTLPEALGLAGGLSDLADRANVKIIRQVGSKAEVHYVNLLDEDLVKSPYYYVHQNDIIVVPALKLRPFRTYFAQNLSLALSLASVVLLIVTLNRR